MYRLGELSKSLNQQYSVASELRRNLEAEAALHTSNVSSGILPINHLTGCCLWVYFRHTLLQLAANGSCKS